jgi:hypothetical protein
MSSRKYFLGIGAAILSAILAGHASAGNLIVNGGFETGDLTGWTMTGNYVAGDDGVVMQDGSVNPIFPHSGSYLVNFSNYASDGAAGITQDVATSPGQSYTLSYWFTTNADGSPANPNEFQVTWDGSVLIDMTNFPSLQKVWTNYTFTVTGTGSDIVGFSGYQDADRNGLDDISLVASSSAVPEPSTLALLGVAAVTALGSVGWRRRKQPSAVETGTREEKRDIGLCASLSRQSLYARRGKRDGHGTETGTRLVVGWA